MAEATEAEARPERRIWTPGTIAVLVLLWAFYSWGAGLSGVGGLLGSLLGAMFVVAVGKAVWMSLQGR